MKNRNVNLNRKNKHCYFPLVLCILFEYLNLYSRQLITVKDDIKDANANNKKLVDNLNTCLKATEGRLEALENYFKESIDEKRKVPKELAVSIAYYLLKGNQT